LNEERRDAPNIKSGAIVMSSLSDDEKKKLTQELLHEYPDRYIYSGGDEFPYEVEFLDGMIETEVANISNIKIKRKK
jgi:hypothetical protein